MATGLQYVQAIELILDTELRTQQGARDSAVAERIKKIVEPWEIDPRSRRLAGAIKAIKTKSGGAESEEAQRKVFRDRFPQLGNMQDGDLDTFIKVLSQSIWDIDQSLYKSRTSLSTISTVLRPLSTKWLERWRLIRTDNFNYDLTMLKVQGLWNREIQSIEGLRMWMEEVYDLFNEVVIYHRAPGAPIQKGAPMGMVGSGNERMYRRNWTAFRADYEEQLVKVAEKVATGDLRSAVGTSLGMSYVSTYLAQRNELTHGYNQSEYIEPQSPTRLAVQQESASLASPQPERKYEIKFESAELGQGKAEKAWATKEALRNEITKFMELIAGTWGQAGEVTHVTFTFPSDGSPTNVRVANKTPQEAASAVIKLLELAD